MTVRLTDTSAARRPRHAGLRLFRPRPHRLLRRWESEHGIIGASPRPGRHRYIQFVDEPLPVHRDTVEMPLASAFVSLAGSR